MQLPVLFQKYNLFLETKGCRMIPKIFALMRVIWDLTSTAFLFWKKKQNRRNLGRTYYQTQSFVAYGAIQIPCSIPCPKSRALQMAKSLPFEAQHFGAFFLKDNGLCTFVLLCATASSDCEKRNSCFKNCLAYHCFES